jgi:hypothetical protein
MKSLCITLARTNASTNGSPQTPSAKLLHSGRLHRQAAMAPHRPTQTARIRASGDARHPLLKLMTETPPRPPGPHRRWPRRGATLTRSTLGRGRSRLGKYGYNTSHFRSSFSGGVLFPLSLARGQPRELLTDATPHRPPATGTSHRIHSRTGTAKMSSDMDARWTFSQARSIARTRAASCGCATGVLNTWPTARRGRYIWCVQLPRLLAYGGCLC